MSLEESLEERQDNEVAALKAIYGDAVTDVREQDVWKVRRPPELLVRLRPQESMEAKEAHVSVVLHIKCDERYPSSTPMVQLLQPKGLSDAVMKKCQKSLELQVLRLKGQEMMYALAESVQVFLYAHNNPASKSFYDQMMMKQRTEAERLAADDRRRRELLLQQRESEMQMIEEEVEKRKSFMQQEEKNVRVRFEEPEEDFGKFADSNGALNPLSTSPRIPLGGPGGRPPKFQTIEPTLKLHSVFANLKEPVAMELHSGRKKRLQIIKSFDRRNSGNFVHFALDLDNNSALVVLYEWIFQWRPTKRKYNAQQLETLKEEAVKYLKQLDVIDAEFQCISKLKHAGLVQYLGWRYGYQKDHVYAHVLKDFVHGTPISSLLNEHAAFSIDQGRSLARQLLDTLSYLHRNDVVHRHMLPSSVFLSNGGSFLLADYAIERKIEDVYQFSLKETDETITYTRGGKKSDILHFGILLSSVLTGMVLSDDTSEPPVNLPTEAKDFIGKCLPQLDKDRWSAEQLLAHRFVAMKPTMSDKMDVIAPTKSEKGFYKDLQEAVAEEETSDLAAKLATRSLALPSESRLHREFEIQQFCGRGGYGDVLKVRNVLDGRCYAIKRIPLNDVREKLNNKIRREVQLLSRLNHENVVRYYNSWIESVIPEPHNKDESSNTTAETGPKNMKAQAKQPEGFVNSFGFFPDDIEKNAPPAVDDSVEWSNEIVAGDHEMDSAENSQTGDLHFFGPFYQNNAPKVSESSSFGEIMFGTDGVARSTSSESLPSDAIKPASQPYTTDSSIKSLVPTVVLFIQMEYCEKSTLRNCIDEGLYRNPERVWRLFREIVEGLGHIHQQGIIHRDLKPANIFIDSEDHVRIGDFGLATHTLISRSTFAENLSDLSYSRGDTAETDEVSRTGRIGTALYVAPELVENLPKAVYSQKVDMYSLGISFFEMFHRPLPTGMERTKVLQNLRQIPLQFPADIDSVVLRQQMSVVSWLLERDPRKRPHASELLQSDLLPPPQIEEAEVNEIIRHTIQNPQSKVYKHLLTSLFSQKMSPVTDLTYDLGIHKLSRSLDGTVVSPVCHEEQRDHAALQIVGAVRLHTPLLLPQSDAYAGRDNIVPLMDTSGDVILIPHDLRMVDFFSDCVSILLLNEFRRGNENTTVNVTSSDSFTFCETLLVITRKLLHIGNDEIYICILRNREAAYRKVESSIGVPTIGHQVPFARYVARNNINSMKRFCIDRVFRGRKIAAAHPREIYECSFDVVTQFPDSLLADAECVSVITDIVNAFPALAKRSFHLRVNHADFLRAAFSNAGVAEDKLDRALDLLWEIRYDNVSKVQARQRLAEVCELNDHSYAFLEKLLETEGPLNVISGFVKTIIKRKGVAGSLARKALHETENFLSILEKLGCPFRVDICLGLTDKYMRSGVIFHVVQPADRRGRSAEVFAAGGRYSSLVQEFHRRKSGKDADLLPVAVGMSIAFEKLVSIVMTDEFLRQSAVDVLICAVGISSLLKEQINLLRDLRHQGVKADILMDPSPVLEDTQDFCKRMGIHLVILKDSANCTIRFVERERISERKLATSEAAEWVAQRIFTVKNESSEALSAYPENVLAPVTQNLPGNRVKITFVTSEKLHGRDRKRYSTHLLTVLESTIASFSSQITLELLAVELPGTVLKWLPAHMSRSVTGNIRFDEWSQLCDRFPRHRKYFHQMQDVLQDEPFNPKVRLIIVSLVDDTYRFLT